MTLTEHSNVFGPNTRYKGAASPEILEIGRNTETGMDVKIHTLSNGATLVMVSPGHGFKFSDGSECGPQDADVCSKLNLKRELRKKAEIKGMNLNEVRMFLDESQRQFLAELCGMADVVVIPFPVLAALREQGIRDQFPNAVAFNATPDTMRSAPSEKIVDINNWSY